MTEHRDVPGAERPFARVERVDQVESTSTTLREAATADPAAWPHLSVLVTEHQTAGRGRAGRTWTTPPGTALTASVLVRPRVPPERLAWLTLLSGLAVVRALRACGPVVIGIKWPNDVLVVGDEPELPGWGRARKVAGILTEALPLRPGDPPAAVVGIGVNLRQDTADLPVSSATSLVLAGLDVPAASTILDGIGRELGALLERWEAHAADPSASGLRDAVSAACLTLGRPVEVDRPGGVPLRGIAESIDDEGRLVVRSPGDERSAVVAGDVMHLREPTEPQGAGREADRALTWPGDVGDAHADRER